MYFLLQRIKYCFEYRYYNEAITDAVTQSIYAIYTVATEKNIVANGILVYGEIESIVDGPFVYNIIRIDQRPTFNFVLRIYKLNTAVDTDFTYGVITANKIKYTDELNVEEALDTLDKNKVSKEPGKGLSSFDYDLNEKNQNLQNKNDISSLFNKFTQLANGGLVAAKAKHSTSADNANYATTAGRANSAATVDGGAVKTIVQQFITNNGFNLNIEDKFETIVVSRKEWTGPFSKDWVKHYCNHNWHIITIGELRIVYGCVENLEQNFDTWVGWGKNLFKNGGTNGYVIIPGFTIENRSDGRGMDEPVHVKGKAQNGFTFYNSNGYTATGTYIAIGLKA